MSRKERRHMTLTPSRQAAIRFIVNGYLEKQEKRTAKKRKRRKAA